MPPRDKDIKAIKERMYKHKWKSLRARGIQPPANEEENKERLRQAHGR